MVKKKLFVFTSVTILFIILCVMSYPAINYYLVDPTGKSVEETFNVELNLPYKTENEYAYFKNQGNFVKYYRITFDKEYMDEFINSFQGFQLCEYKFGENSYRPDIPGLNIKDIIQDRPLAYAITSKNDVELFYNIWVYKKTDCREIVIREKDNTVVVDMLYY